MKFAISTKSGPIATRRKANISIWILGLKFDNGFDLGHDLDIWIFKVICDLDRLVTKVRCKDLPDSDRGDFSCRRAVDSSSLLLTLCPQVQMSSRGDQPNHRQIANSCSTDAGLHQPGWAVETPAAWRPHAITPRLTTAINSVCRSPITNQWWYTTEPLTWCQPGQAC